MRKILVLFILLAFIGCATGDRFRRLQKGMVEDRATNIMGEPDWVEKRGEYVVFRYEDRLLEYYPSYARVDFYVIAENGLVVDFGIGKIRSELPPPEKKCNVGLGTIGVVPALFLPEAEVDTPGGWEENLNGAGQAIAQVPATGLWFLDLAICAGAASAGWCDTAAQNRKLAVPDDEVEEMRRVITNAIGEFKIQETISVYLSKTVVELTDCRLDLLQGKGAHDPDEEPNYRFLERDGIDHVLEVSVRSVGFKSGPGENPNIFFFMTVHCRFVRAGDEEEVFSKDLHWASDKSFKLADYVDNDSRLLQEEIDRSCEEISAKIAGRLLYE
ncbi:MAG: hypothetical protein OEV09_16135 [Deltaproteobacteria bacterium]|nr:hypothetical protein [Deltaproteobacteria bacterium]MDH3929328.1 hypothetical protein [Deltaproteobacteria bacterium]